MEPGAGELNKRITINMVTFDKDAKGGKIKQITPWINNLVSAKVQNFSGDEKKATGQGGNTGVARTVFTIRFRPGLTTSHEIVFKGVTYNIRHINNFKEESRWLVITCDTGNANG